MLCSGLKTFKMATRGTAGRQPRCWSRTSCLLIFVISLALSNDVRGRPAEIRSRRQANDPHNGIPENPFDALCPIVDCGEFALPCARDVRVPSTFQINGNKCQGCLECPPTATTTPPAKNDG